jgi:ABC-type branched-subunit amino acid transport system substrate-binding protein
MGTSRPFRTITTAAVLVVVCLTQWSVAASVAGAGGNIEPTGHRDGTLTIGQLAPQSGDLSNLVQSVTTAVTLGIDEINAAGGVLGQTVGYSLADDGNNSDVATASLETLLEGGRVDAIMGPTTSGTMLGILDLVREAKVLDCSGSNFSLELSTARSDGFYFRTTPPDTLQGAALAKLVLRDQPKRVAVLARRDTYGVGLERPFRATLSDGGARVVAGVRYDPDATSFDADVARVAKAKPDAVVVLGFETDGADVVRTMIGQGLGPQQVAIYTADDMRDHLGELVDANNPGVVAGTKGVSPAAAPAGVQSPFLERFATTGVDPFFSAYYYDCTVLTALAAEKSKSDDPTKMKRAFAANTRGKVKCSTFADCKKALDDKKTIQYQGASAVFPRMNDFGKFEPRAGAYEVWALDANAHDIVEPPETQIRVA